jgi:hypothetical protein
MLQCLCFRPSVVFETLGVVPALLLSLGFAANRTTELHKGCVPHLPCLVFVVQGTSNAENDERGSCTFGTREVPSRNGHQVPAAACNMLDAHWLSQTVHSKLWFFASNVQVKLLAFVHGCA